MLEPKRYLGCPYPMDDCRLLTCPYLLGNAGIKRWVDRHKGPGAFAEPSWILPVGPCTSNIDVVGPTAMIHQPSSTWKPGPPTLSSGACCASGSAAPRVALQLYITCTYDGFRGAMSLLRHSLLVRCRQNHSSTPVGLPYAQRGLWKGKPITDDRLVRDPHHRNSIA